MVDAVEASTAADRILAQLADDGPANLVYQIELCARAAQENNSLKLRLAAAEAELCQRRRTAKLQEWRITAYLLAEELSMYEPDDDVKEGDIRQLMHDTTSMILTCQNGITEALQLDGLANQWLCLSKLLHAKDLTHSDISHLTCTPACGDCLQVFLEKDRGRIRRFPTTNARCNFEA